MQMSHKEKITTTLDQDAYTPVDPKDNAYIC